MRLRLYALFDRPLGAAAVAKVTLEQARPKPAAGAQGFRPTMEELLACLVHVCLAVLCTTFLLYRRSSCRGLPFNLSARLHWSWETLRGDVLAKSKKKGPSCLGRKVVGVTL